MSAPRKILASAMLILGFLVGNGGAIGQTPVPSADRTAVTIEAGSGQVITLRRAATNVFVADPKVATPSHWAPARSPTAPAAFRSAAPATTAR